jgi:hypothetical protein
VGPQVINEQNHDGATLSSNNVGWKILVIENLNMKDGKISANESN